MNELDYFNPFDDANFMAEGYDEFEAEQEFNMAAKRIWDHVEKFKK
jgi:hypothetical protein